MDVPCVLFLIVMIASLIVVVVSLEFSIGDRNGTSPIVPVPVGPISTFKLRDFDCVYAAETFCFSDEVEICVLMKEHFGRRPSFVRAAPYKGCSEQLCDGFSCFVEV